MGGQGDSSQYMVQDVAAGSISGAASVREAVPCESGVDVGWLSVDGSGGDEVGEQDVGASLAFSISYGAVQGPAGAEGQRMWPARSMAGSWRKLADVAGGHWGE